MGRGESDGYRHSEKVKKKVVLIIRKEKIVFEHKAQSDSQSFHFLLILHLYLLDGVT